jgi:hypothetical protein
LIYIYIRHGNRNLLWHVEKKLSDYENKICKTIFRLMGFCGIIRLAEGKKHKGIKKGEEYEANSIMSAGCRIGFYAMPTYPCHGKRGERHGK